MIARRNDYLHKIDQLIGEKIYSLNGLCDISSRPKNFPFQKRSEVDENLILDLIS